MYSRGKSPWLKSTSPILTLPGKDNKQSISIIDEMSYLFPCNVIYLFVLADKNVLKTLLIAQTKEILCNGH